MWRVSTDYFPTDWRTRTHTAEELVVACPTDRTWRACTPQARGYELRSRRRARTLRVAVPVTHHTASWWLRRARRDVTVRGLSVTTDSCVRTEWSVAIQIPRDSATSNMYRGVSAEKRPPSRDLCVTRRVTIWSNTQTLNVCGNLRVVSA
jgi:hypothetical protein